MKAVLAFHNWDGWYENLSVTDTLAWNAQCDQMPYYRKYASIGKVLEGGCGLGRLVLQLSKEGCDIIGIDNSETAITKAKQYTPDLPVQLGDICSLEFPDDYFSAYISVGVIEHFQEGPWRVLAETKRVLKPGGCLLIDVPVYNLVLRLTEHLPWVDLHHWLVRRPGLRALFRRPARPRPTEFCNYLYTHKEFAAVLQKAGFEILHLVPVQHTYGLAHSLSPGLSRLVIDRRSQWFDPHPNHLGRVLLGLRHVNPWLFPQSVFAVARKPLGAEGEN